MLVTLSVIGVVVGCVGTLIGAGGGFILMPIFFFLFPESPPEKLTSLSLIVVFANALSGSIAYGRLGRIDYPSGILFSLASIPGALVGALATARLTRETFDLVFAFLLIVGGTYLWMRPVSHSLSHGKDSLLKPGYRQPKRLLVGCGVSFGVGFVACLLGIGGGIIHVPVLSQVLEFPVHIATATSHFVLALTSLVGVVVHYLNGEYSGHGLEIFALCSSVMLGAQVGAKLSGKVQDKWIMRGLAGGLVSVGIRLLYVHFQVRS